jgi:hypothetical protein
MGVKLGTLEVSEEHRHRVLENKVPRKIFLSEWLKVTKDWRKLHNDEHCNWYCPPNSIPVVKSRRMRWARHVARSGENRN